jgi:hypothetical protein
MVRKHHRDATLQGDLKALKMELGTRAWARNAGRRSSRDRPTTRRSPAEPSACGPKLERTVRATASDGPPAVDQIISGAIMARSTGRAAIRRDVDLAGLPRHLPCDLAGGSRCITCAKAESRPAAPLQQLAQPPRSEREQGPRSENALKIDARGRCWVWRDHLEKLLRDAPECQPISDLGSDAAAGRDNDGRLTRFSSAIW